MAWLGIWTLCIGLSISPAQLATTRSNSSSGRTRVPSSKTQHRQFSFGSLTSKPTQPDLPKERKTCYDFKLSDEFSSMIWQISATKIPDPAILGTIWGEKHRIWQNLYQIRLDRTGFRQIERDLANFLLFSALSSRFWPHPKQPLTRRETNS